MHTYLSYHGRQDIALNAKKWRLSSCSVSYPSLTLVNEPYCSAMGLGLYNRNTTSASFTMPESKYKKAWLVLLLLPKRRSPAPFAADPKPSLMIRTTSNLCPSGEVRPSLTTATSRATISTFN